jgi:hypothetical protein
MTLKYSLSLAILGIAMATNVSSTSGEGKTLLEKLQRSEPLVLELALQSGEALRHEILVEEGKPFRVVTRRENVRWLVEGKVEKLANNVAIVHLKVGVFGAHRSAITSQTPMKMELKVNEFKGDGFGSNHLAISDLWIRRGINSVPVLTKQLSDPKLAEAAVIRLGYLGAEAKSAVPTLKKLTTGDNVRLKEAASEALSKIEQD